MNRMPHDLVRPPKARRGERVAVLSPSFAAAGAFPAVHEQAMRRLAEVTELVPVEHLGPGPGVDDIHGRSLLAALITGETLEITDRVPSNAMPSLRSSAGTTPKPWCASAFHSATPVRSGSSRTAARSQSTAPRAA